MKKHLTNLMSIGLALTLALSLTACGGDSKAEETNETRDPVAAITGQNGARQPAEGAAEGVTLSDWLGGGESIWYLTETPVSQLGKDTKVETLLLLEPDGTAYAGSSDGLTLGDFAQMDEGEIAQMAQEAYAQETRAKLLRGFADASDEDRMRMLDSELFEYSLPGYIDGDIWTEELLNSRDLPEALDEPLRRYLEVFQSYTGDRQVLQDVISGLCNGDSEALSYAAETGSESGDAITAVVEQAYAIQDEIAEVLSAESQPGRWALGLNTDQTGNNAESVTFAWCVYRPDATEISSVTCYASSGEGRSVYDVLYGGVDLNGGGALVTRVDGSYAVGLEDTDSGLPLDAEPEELFS